MAMPHQCLIQSPSSTWVLVIYQRAYQQTARVISQLFLASLKTPHPAFFMNLFLILLSQSHRPMLSGGISTGGKGNLSVFVSHHSRSLISTLFMNLVLILLSQSHWPMASQGVSTDGEGNVSTSACISRHPSTLHESISHSPVQISSIHHPQSIGPANPQSVEAIKFWKVILHLENARVPFSCWHLLSVSYWAMSYESCWFASLPLVRSQHTISIGQKPVASLASLVELMNWFFRGTWKPLS